MDVGSQPDVVGQIPAIVVGIVVDYDIVGSPVPIIAITEVIRGNGKVEAAKPEAARASAFNAKRVPSSNTAGKSSMLKGMIDMVMRIVPAGIVAHPPVPIGVDVWSVRVALHIAVGTSTVRGSLPGLFLRLSGLLLRLARLFLRLAGWLLRPCGRCGTWMRRRAARGNVSSANATDGGASLSASLLFSTAVLRRSGDA
jgi:hypothetical protein